MDKHSRLGKSFNDEVQRCLWIPKHTNCQLISRFHLHIFENCPTLAKGYLDLAGKLETIIGQCQSPERTFTVRGNQRQQIINDIAILWSERSERMNVIEIAFCFFSTCEVVVASPQGVNHPRTHICNTLTPWCEIVHTSQENCHEIKWGSARSVSSWFNGRTDGDSLLFVVVYD